jgi:hypothetical protein
MKQASGWMREVSEESTPAMKISVSRIGNQVGRTRDIDLYRFRYDVLKGPNWLEGR